MLRLGIRGVNKKSLSQEDKDMDSAMSENEGLEGDLSSDYSDEESSVETSETFEVS